MKKYRIQLSCSAAAVVILLLAASGCVHYQGESAVGTIIATSEAFKAFDGEYENTPYFKNHKPESIAVLPFSSLEEKLFTLKGGMEHPEDIVRKGLYNHISSLPFKDLEIDDINRRLLNAGIQETDEIKTLIAENPKKLKSILGVEAAVVGSVTHFDKIFVGVYSQVAVGCEATLWDLETGNLLWRAKHVSRAHAGGISLNPIGLLLSAAASAWNLRNEELLSQTDELFREIVSTIELPPSMRIVPKTKTVIDLFAVMNTERPFTAGKEISFRIIGDRDCSAYVDLGDYKSGIDLSPLAPAMKASLKSDIMASIQQRYQEAGQSPPPEMLAEVEKGFSAREVYEGVYTVSPGEERYGITAKAYLVNSFGDQVSKLDVYHPVDIDAMPPAATVGLASESLNRKVRIGWSANQEKDLAAYEIWTSPSPLSGFTLHEASERPDYYFDNAVNFDRFYVKVRAVDGAGNQGEFGPSVAAVALPRQNLYDLPQPGPVLDGTVDGSILLVKDKSPYRVQAEIRIPPGAALHAEPGVEIRFSPRAALVVEGGSFFAYGRKDLPVKLVPSAFEAEPGAWQGLTLNHTRDTILNHVVIEKAQTGISILDSSPEIFAAVVRECSQAGIFMKENARPHIACSLISANRGQGALVIEGGGVAPMVHNNAFVGNTPFGVQSYTPLEIDLSGNYWGNAAPDESLFLGRVVWEPFLALPPEACDER